MADQMLEKNQQARQAAQELHERLRCAAAEVRAEHHRPAVRFTLEPGEPGLCESKVGGTPYLPRDMAWPLDSAGAGLGLLAQVDCAGLSGLPDFPTTWLLQFFTAWDEVFGADFDCPTRQTGFRVLYHREVDPSVTREEVEARRPPLPEESRWFTPLCGGPFRIRLGPVEEQGIPAWAPDFDALFAGTWNRLHPDLPVRGYWDVYEQIPERLRDYQATDQPGWNSPLHQLGGWFGFPGSPLPECLDVLLFQLDSDGDGLDDWVLWGDCGVGGFFISRQALRARDFSQTAYLWDCS